MQLNILKYPEYLSPSSLSEWNTCQHKFYLKRMASTVYVPNVQTYAAAVGSVFDAFIKCEIGKAIGHPMESPSFYISKNVDASLRDRAVVEGSNLFTAYVSDGCFKRLMKSGILFIELDKTVNITDGHNEVPLRGLPDLFKSDGTPLEFKVSGAGSKSGQSPCPGYKSCYLRGVNKGAHARFGEPLEELNEAWAEQLTAYNWIYGNYLPLRDRSVAVEQVAIRGSTVCFASIETHVTAEFQKRLFAKFLEAWNNIRSGIIQQAMPEPGRCNKWGALCEMSEYCTAYKAVQDLPADIRELRGYR